MMLTELLKPAKCSEDHRALAAACESEVGLCTIVGIDGSFSRRLGAQLAVLPDGSTIGSLADGCLEAQLAADIRKIDQPQVVRYGQGSDKIDFRLPCGGGLDILLDPAPDRSACRQALANVLDRRPSRLALPKISPLKFRQYLPELRIVAFGEGPELQSLADITQGLRIALELRPKDSLSLGKAAHDCSFDPWTAVILLFHDHEWEGALLEQALSSEAFFVGAQGGENARVERSLNLAARGLSEEQIVRVRSPIGLIPSCKSPSTLALSALAEIVGEYEQLIAGN